MSGAKAITYVESLKKLLQETKDLTKDDKLTEKLSEAQKLIAKLETVDTGILTQFRLDGQVALVTGGGQGIGKAFCLALGEAGCKVAVADLNLSHAETVVSELKQKSIEAIAIKVDVSKKEDVENMVKQVLSTFGDLHIACNNAGIAFYSASEDTTETEWRKTMGVNLDGVFFCCQAEGKHMLSKGYGKIINVTSIAATTVNRPQTQVAYNASKAGVLHMTKVLGCEWAARGVRVNCISPAYVNTPLCQDAPAAARDVWIRGTPMGRLADTSDLVGGLLYLASPLSNYTTGLNLLIDGGYTCW